MTEKTYNLTVNFYIPGETLEDSYRKLSDSLQNLDFGWETTDEAYDLNGDLIDADDLQRAIINVTEVKESIYKVKH